MANALTINEAISNAVCDLVKREQRPIRLSDMFMKRWCGAYQPPEELELWLRDRGFEILPGLDQHGGFDVRLISAATAGEALPLFGGACA